jgi:UDP-N-acetylmuramoyl-tripeptide--D-alanyl-D-alanine ligase
MTALLWTAEEAAAATGGRSTAPWSAKGVSIDSRTLDPNDLFIALVGPHHDGHGFVGPAFASGAAAGMVAREMPQLPGDRPLLIVDDTMAGLNDLASAARSRSPARIVAITGSVGKTGTKEALRLVLERQGPTCATTGNLNNQWGAPLSLARMPRNSAFGVFELGMNSPGEIAPLSRLVRPHVAIITTVEPAHIEFFDSVEQIADAKAEIFEGVEPGGTAVLNRDNPHFDRLAAAARRCGIENMIAFGAHADADARLVECEAEPQASKVTAEILGRTLRYRIGVPGRHWVINSLAVLAAAAALRTDLDLAAAALADLEALAGRGRQYPIDWPGGSIQVIDESYNAGPASTRAAFDVLALARPESNGRRIAVLGDMLELGPAAESLHAGLAEDLKTQPIDLVFTAGANMAVLNAALPKAQRGQHAADAEKLAPVIVATLRAGDVVMIKGSLGSRMGVVVEALSKVVDAPPRAVNGN